MLVAITALAADAVIGAVHTKPRFSVSAGRVQLRCPPPDMLPCLRLRVCSFQDDAQKATAAYRMVSEQTRTGWSLLPQRV